MEDAEPPTTGSLWKLSKEDFVSGLSGGSIREIVLVSAVSLSGYALWLAAYGPDGLFDPRHYGPAAFLADFAINGLCLLLAVTLYAQRPVLLNASLLMAVLVLSLSAKQYRARRKGSVVVETKQDGRRGPETEQDGRRGPETEQDGRRGPDTKQDGRRGPDNQRKAYITVYRGSMMVMTCLAILAVDFKIFPRRFAKVETWGTSLMDLGVGSFVFSAGLVSAKSTRKNSSKPVWKQLLVSLRHSFPLLAIGFVRVILTKSIAYPEHVSEYGVHWNFFFTLGLLAPMNVLFNVFKRRGISELVLSVLIGFTYEFFLRYSSLKRWVLIGPRNNLLTQNREGLVSLLGYTSIFMGGSDLGMRLFDPAATRSNFYNLLYTSLIWCLIYYVSSEVVYLQVSRRLANLPYIAWVNAYNAFFLLSYYLTAWYFRGTKASYQRSVPLILESINNHGLSIFLLANAATGLVNLSFNSLKVSTVSSFVILTGYIAFICSAACLLDIRNRRKLL